MRKKASGRSSRSDRRNGRANRMARIERFSLGRRDRPTLHDPIEATMYLFELDGRRLMQIDTSGRNTRELPGKTSQSIQLDEQAARELYDSLARHFGFR